MRPVIRDGVGVHIGVPVGLPCFFFFRSHYSLLVSFLLFFCSGGRALPFGPFQNTNDVMTQKLGLEHSHCHLYSFLLYFFS